MITRWTRAWAWCSPVVMICRRKISRSRSPEQFPISKESCWGEPGYNGPFEGEDWTRLSSLDRVLTVPHWRLEESGFRVLLLLGFTGKGRGQKEGEGLRATQGRANLSGAERIAEIVLGPWLVRLKSVSIHALSTIWHWSIIQSNKLSRTSAHCDRW